MKRIDLCGSDWQLAYIKNSDYVNCGSPEQLDDVLAVSSVVGAEVPGNLEIDLERAGVIEDPFFGANHSKRDCEYLHAFYYKSFVYDGSPENPALYFEGIDTIADIYVNGTLVGRTDNMLIPHKLPLGDALKIGENLLTVHIRPAVIEARKYPAAAGESAAAYTLEGLHIRKAAHMYGWDIMPRIVSLGIWRGVSIIEEKKERIDEFYCYTSKCNEKEAHLRYSLNVTIGRDECMDYSVRITGVCGESVFKSEAKLHHTSAENPIKLPAPKLWWPRNCGEQNLYDVTVELMYLGEVIDTYKTTLGIRVAELIRSSVIDENGEGEFCFKVNGKRVFLMGTNWVPVDALHSRDEKRIPDILPMLTDINCNVIRIWGGNVYENDLLYDFCDREGILIWQDFCMGCAVYPQDDDFMSRLAVEIETVVKRLRHHPSIILWAGDNENDIAITWRGLFPRDPNGNRITRELIPRILYMHDYTRPYLPSSPYVDSIAYERKGKTTEDHLWGPRDYFKGNFYRNSVCCFASETGYHACNSPESVKRFIPEDCIWTSENSENWQGIDNPMWLYHSASPELQSAYTYRIRLMANQVTTLFGKTVPNTLSDFAKASQISQAEAKKYFIERFRVTKWRRTGIIWWNLIDGWPQFSDAVVDYYGIKKLAYHYIKRSQNPVCMIFDEPEGGMLPLYAVNEYCEEKQLTYRVTDMTVGAVVAEGTVIAEGEKSTPVLSIPCSSDEKHFYYIEWECDGERHSNHYMTNIRDIDYAEYLGYLCAAGYDSFEGFGE